MSVAEIIAVLSALKALGFDMVLILSLVIISLIATIVAIVASWKLVSFFTKGFKESVDSVKVSLSELTLSVKRVNETITSHMDITEKQMLDGEKRFGNIEKELKEIKVHVGLK